MRYNHCRDFGDWWNLSFTCLGSPQLPLFYAYMLISHCKVFTLLFLCLCNPFQKDHYDHRFALLLAIWQGRYYKTQKSPIHKKIFNESSEIVSSEAFELSLHHSLPLCFLRDIKLGNNIRVFIIIAYTHLGSSNFYRQWLKKALLVYHYHLLYDGGGNARDFCALLGTVSFHFLKTMYFYRPPFSSRHLKPTWSCSYISVQIKLSKGAWVSGSMIS